MVEFTGSNGSGLDDRVYGVIRSLTKDDATARQAMEAAQALTPQPREISGAELALQFFSNMAANASQPGSTVLSSAASAVKPTADEYIRQVEANRKAKEATGPLAISLAKALKPDKVTPRAPVQVIVDGKARFVDPAVAIKEGYEAYNKDSSTGTYKSVLVKKNDGLGFVKDYMNNSEIKAAKAAGFEVKDDKDTTSSASGPNDYQVPTDKIEEFKTEFPNIAIGENGVVLLTNEQFIDAQKIVLPYDKNDSVNEAKTQVGKLFGDLSNHKVGSDAYNAIMVEIQALENKGTWDKDRYSGEKDLRAEWNKVNYPYAEVRANYNKLRAALEPDRNSDGEIIESKKKGAGDMSAVFLFMKMLDPGSVVRESEFQAAQATAGAIDQLGIKIAQLKEGDILSPGQRKDFLKLAKDFMEAGTELKNETRLNLGTAVKNYGLNPKNVFGVELAPSGFYLNSSAYKVANSKGVTLDAMWQGMSAAERNAYLPSAGGN